MTRAAPSRLRGDGSYRTRPDGRVELRTNIGGVRKSFYGWNQREARAARDEYLRQHHLGLIANAGTLTLNDFWLEYLEHLEHIQKEISDLTRLDYERTWTRNFEKGIGEMRLNAIGITDVTGAMKRISARFERGKGHRTLEYAYVLLKACLEHAVTLELLPRNPAAKAPRPKRVHVERDFYTREELGAYLEAAKGERLAAGVMLAVTAGLRRAEILGFRDADLDWKTGRYTVQNTVRHITKRGFVMKSAKSGKSRQVFLSADVLELLRLRRAQRDLERKTAGENWHEHGLLFTAANGNPVDAKILWNAHNRIIGNAKLERDGVPVKLRPISIHELRHTYTTLAIAKGVDEKALSKALGHSNVAFTRVFYQHVLQEQLDATSLSLSDILPPQKPKTPRKNQKRLWGKRGVKRSGLTKRKGARG